LVPNQPASHAFLVWLAFTFNERKTMNTEIMLPVPELKQALGGLNKLVGKKTTLPVLSCVRISRQKNGLVTLQGTDLDGHATFTLNKTQPGEVVDVLVPLEQLNKACKCSGTTDPVALVCEGQSTKLRYFLGGCPLNLPVNPLLVDEWPPMPAITAPTTPLPPGFGEALKQAMACCSDNPTRQVLRGACMDSRDAKAHYVVGTNGQFLYSANSFTFPMKEAVIVPDSKFINGSGLLDDEPCFLSIQPGKKPTDVKHICFQNKQWQFVTREIEGQYPNWKQCVPTIGGSWTMVKLSPSAVEQLLTVIPNLPGKDTEHQAIRLCTGKNSLLVEGRNKEDEEWTSIAVADVTVTGKAKEICLNRDYLLPALKFGLVELAIDNELSPMVCSHVGKRIVIMPVRPSAPTTKVEAPKPSPTPVAPQTQPTTPPSPNAEAQPERKPEMTQTSSKPAPKPAPSPLLIDQVETIKETLKNVIRDLTSLADSAKQAEKEQRASEKEVEAARAALKKLQQVQI
jgi:DNA polymerase III sliding clamp (beta) subunit (PCNA family)